MALVEAFLEILKRPTTWAMILGMIQFLGPVWVAFLLGITVGWAWKPRWATLGNCKFDASTPTSPSLFNGFSSAQGSNASKAGSASYGSCVDNGLVKEQKALLAIDNAVCSESKLGKEENTVITHDDLEHLCHLVERKDGGPPWKHIMDRSAENMSYQAWQRDPEVLRKCSRIIDLDDFFLYSGPPQYCSRTVYEGATPELLRDFFWDDDFRLKWDNMLTHASIVEECPTTGTMVVHWIRKFPFFCSDREYIIGRRIWESGRSYYCVTKAKEFPVLLCRGETSLDGVDLCYSSWFIQAVESRKGDGELSACEVILFHHEDMGIPWEIAKFGVRQGMWGTVKNIERGSGHIKSTEHPSTLSHHAFMAQINMKLDPDYLKTLEGNEISSADEKPKGPKIPKLLIIGGAIAVACSLDRGLLTKTLIFGIARKLANIGRRACPRPG